VLSADQTAISYDRLGSGPSIILVDGALGYRRFGPLPALVPLLAPSLSVITYDRRGRGQSGDTLPYAPERELEDLDALLEIAGGAASLLGHSSGACLSLLAAARLGAKVERLLLYEPPYYPEPGPDEAWSVHGHDLATLLAEGRRGDALALFMSFLGAPPEMIEQTRSTPLWSTLEAVAPTLAYDRAVIGEGRKVPIELAARVNVPALVMNGSLAPSYIVRAAELLAEALVDGRHLVLEGQRHDVASTALAPVVLEFLGS
jgi:pimeloyl-ACP methyl ester carboxylesterase